MATLLVVSEGVIILNELRIQQASSVFFLERNCRGKK